MSVHTPTQALAAARALHGRAPAQARAGMCLSVTRDLYALPHTGGSAAASFRATKLRGHGPPPAGAPLWFTGGSKGFGHSALAAAGLRAWTIDQVRSGGLDLVTLARLRGWTSSLHYEGWSRDIDGVTVIPLVSLSKLLAGDKEAFVVVTRALVDKGLLRPNVPAGGSWSALVLVAYARLQELYGYGPATPGHKGPSDGRPGIGSLTRLGLERGFVVAP